MIMTENKILNQIYKKAKQDYDKKLKLNFPKKVVAQVHFMIGKISTNKSLVAALVTSCLKKIINPKQDIRLHRTDFSKGYSARVLDTKFTTPFFKRHFPKYSNKETSFLTLATREKIKWNLKEDQNLKIRNRELKLYFLGFLANLSDKKPFSAFKYSESKFQYSFSSKCQSFFINLKAWMYAYIFDFLLGVW